MKLLLRGDQEVTLVLGEVQARRKQETLLERSLVDCHATMGTLERANGTLGETVAYNEACHEDRRQITHRAAGWFDTVVDSTARSVCGQTLGRLTKCCETTATEAGLLVSEKRCGHAARWFRSGCQGMVWIPWSMSRSANGYIR